MFNPIRHLRDLGHDVHVVAFAAEGEAEAAANLRRHCSSVAIVALPTRWQIRGLLSDPPATLAHYSSNEMARVLASVATAHAVDVVELESLHMAVYGKGLSSHRRVLRPQNVEHLIWERYAEARRVPPVQTLIRMQARRVKRYEALAMTSFVDSTLAVSEADRLALSRIAPSARVDWLPMGVDTNDLTPSAEAPVIPWSIVITGSYDWAPKRHNLAVLVREVFPLIQQLAPAARLSVVGRGLDGPLLAELKARNGIDYVGAVPDVRPYIARASVVVNYVESGSGIAIKLLEAMAMGKPIVTNDLGVEGIAATNGTNLLVASSKSEFAQAVSKLLSDIGLQARLGNAARELVVEKYSSAMLAQKLAAYFEMVAGTAGQSSAH